MTALIGALDQGTTSTRFMVFDRHGAVVAHAQQEHRQIFPQPGWVEHDPDEIIANTHQVIARALHDAGLSHRDLTAVGITNQRETTVLWDRATGQAVANAIVWQDTRTEQLCRVLAESEGAQRLQHLTGLPAASYFAGPKVRWLLDQDDILQARAEVGELAFGTIDSWIVWNLTGTGGPAAGARQAGAQHVEALHVTDVTNAARTLLMDLETLQWSPWLCEQVGVPQALLPEIHPSVGWIAEATGPLAGVPITGILGDQQAALFGQTCFGAGDTKNTYGTGCFMLMNTGTDIVRSTNGLLSTVAYQVAGETPRYALEGSVAVAGALVQWLRDNLGIISDSSQVESLAATVTDNGDVYFVPAFSGLFAPHWRSDARGLIVGLTGYATKAHIARAALEATAFQTREVLDAMTADSEAPEELKVDGGMVANDLLMQFQADILGVRVARPAVAETTALGAAYAAGLATGVWSSPEELASTWRADRIWEPRLDNTDRARLYNKWHDALARTLNWVRG